jgi:hypothetical protein
MKRRHGNFKGFVVAVMTAKKWAVPLQQRTARNGFR